MFVYSNYELNNILCLKDNPYFEFQDIILLYFINHVSSSTPKKTPSVRLSLREFKKKFPNTFIYESILIKIYMNANIMNTQIFYFLSMTSAVIEGHKRSLLCLFYP